jgi:RNA polymerase sigma-70 factor (ECF subfamily)
LRDDWRETAALVVGEGLTQVEAGEALGISEGTVAWRMTEVKKALTAFAEAEAKI